MELVCLVESVSEAMLFVERFIYSFGFFDGWRTAQAPYFLSEFIETCFMVHHSCILVNVAYALEENEYSAVCILAYSLNVSQVGGCVRLCIPLLIFYVLVLSVTERGVLKSLTVPSIIVDFTMSPCTTVNFCFMCFEPW